MYILLDTFWLAWMAKYILFWLYLWQLKDYHIPRFIDHFRTSKGKKIFFNFTWFLKIALLGCLFVRPFFDFALSVLLIIYFVQAVIFLRAIIKKSVLKPKRTQKTLFLAFVGFSAVIIFFFYALKTVDSVQPIWLLIFDILTPILISVIVLVFQPIFVVLRSKKLEEAAKKIAETKRAGKLKVIAITGSYGKTSTKEFLTTILSEKFKVLSTKEHQNSEIGVANCILNDLKPEHEIFIAEVGAYDKGKVKEVCNMIGPDMGIVTGVNEQHLALFGSIKNLLSAEGGGELAEALGQNGILFVNGDNKYCLDLYKQFSGKKKIYSFLNKKLDADIWSDGIVVRQDGISFLAMDKTSELMHFDAKILGRHNVQNLLGAILAAKELGMNFGQISDGCGQIKQNQGGIIIKKDKNGINIIDSSYSSNPDGVYADLDYLTVFPAKKVIVMPCLIELGEKSSQIHEKIGKKIGQICDMAIITTKDKFNEIERGFGETKKNKYAKCLLCDKSDDIYSLITLFCKSGDAVLLEGRVPNELIKLLA